MKIKTYQVVAFTSALIAVMVLLLILLTPLNPVFDTYYDDYAITGTDIKCSLLYIPLHPSATSTRTISLTQLSHQYLS